MWRPTGDPPSIISSTGSEGGGKRKRVNFERRTANTAKYRLNFILDPKLGPKAGPETCCVVLCNVIDIAS